MSGFLRNRGPAVVFFALLIGTWEVACRLGFIEPILLPVPSNVLAEALDGLSAGRWNADISLTMTSFGLAFAVATFAGTLLGIATGVSKTLFHLVDPYVVVLNALPKVVLCPLVMLWFGTGITARVFLGAVMATFPIIASTVAGIQSVDRDHMLLVRACRGGRWIVFKDVLLPSVAPYMLSGMRVGVNYAMVGVLVVELFASSRGIGYRLNAYSQNFQGDLFFVLLSVVVVIVLALTGLIRMLEVRFGGWRNSAFR
jgi:NitT/TauT family transport system permease protein